MEPVSLVGIFLPDWDSEVIAQAGELPENLPLSGDPRFEARAGDFLLDCPFPELVIPSPYSISEDGIFAEIIKNNGKKNMSSKHLIQMRDYIVLPTPNSERYWVRIADDEMDLMPEWLTPYIRFQKTEVNSSAR